MIGQNPDMGLARSTVSLLDFIWPRVRGRLDGISDEEYLWEPVPGCWSVRERAGTWEIEREIPAPQPPPVTTIAWRTWHIAAECIDGFLRLGFEAKALDLGDREWFAHADEALAAMDTAWAVFSDCFHQLDDTAMARELGDSFGPYARDNRADLLLHIADELIHHGAEIALLRDLFTATRAAPVR